MQVKVANGRFTLQAEVDVCIYKAAVTPYFALSLTTLPILNLEIENFSSHLLH